MLIRSKNPVIDVACSAAQGYVGSHLSNALFKTSIIPTHGAAACAILSLSQRIFQEIVGSENRRFLFLPTDTNIISDGPALLTTCKALEKLGMLTKTPLWIHNWGIAGITYCTFKLSQSLFSELINYLSASSQNFVLTNTSGKALVNTGLTLLSTAKVLQACAVISQIPTLLFYYGAAAALVTGTALIQSIGLSAYEFLYPTVLDEAHIKFIEEALQKDRAQRFNILIGGDKEGIGTEVIVIIPNSHSYHLQSKDGKPIYEKYFVHEIFRNSINFLCQSELTNEQKTALKNIRQKLKDSSSVHSVHILEKMKVRSNQLEFNKIIDRTTKK
jgi:hypothetical protein